MEGAWQEVDTHVTLPPTSPGVGMAPGADRQHWEHYLELPFLIVSCANQSGKEKKRESPGSSGREG